MTAEYKARCEMRGKHAHDGWQHTTRRGTVKESHRCKLQATRITPARQAMCELCYLNQFGVIRATIRYAKAQLATLVKAKKLK